MEPHPFQRRRAASTPHPNSRLRMAASNPVTIGESGPDGPLPARLHATIAPPVTSGLQPLPAPPAGGLQGRAQPGASLLARSFPASLQARTRRAPPAEAGFSPSPSPSPVPVPLVERLIGPVLAGPPEACPALCQRLVAEARDAVLASPASEGMAGRTSFAACLEALKPLQPLARALVVLPRLMRRPMAARDLVAVRESSEKAMACLEAGMTSLLRQVFERGYGMAATTPDLQTEAAMQLVKLMANLRMLNIRLVGLAGRMHLRPPPLLSDELDRLALLTVRSGGSIRPLHELATIGMGLLVALEALAAARIDRIGTFSRIRSGVMAVVRLMANEPRAATGERAPGPRPEGRILLQQVGSLVAYGRGSVAGGNLGPSYAYWDAIASLHVGVVADLDSGTLDCTERFLNFFASVERFLAMQANNHAWDIMLDASLDMVAGNYIDGSSSSELSTSSDDEEDDD